MSSITKTKYLIDTNIFGLSLTSYHPAINKFLNHLESVDYAVSCFVLAEIEVLKFSSAKEVALELIIELQNQTIIWFDRQQSQIFSFLKYEMNKRKINNRTVDWFIAAQCLDKDYTLVTANRKDFDCIPNLKAKYYDQKNYRWY